MAGSGSYNNYRGRGSGWKFLLALILVLVTVIAVSALALRENIVFDETGRLQLHLPWQTSGGQNSNDNNNKNNNTTDPNPNADPNTQPSENTQNPEDVTVPPEPENQTLYAFTIPASTSLEEGMMEPMAASAPAYNAAVTTLKDSKGMVYYPFQAALRYSHIEQYDSANLVGLTGENSNLTSIARICCLQDPRAANSSIKGLALIGTNGYVYEDGARSSWLDPALPGAQEYLCNIVRETAELGFDEILLTDVSYPTTGRTSRIKATEEERAANIKAFLEMIKNLLAPYQTKLSIELSESVLTNGSDVDAGQNLAEIAPLVDRIYVQTTPEQVATLSAAVEAAPGDATFVPELTEYSPDVTGDCLVFWD